ncbi:MAG: hypothetical protein HYX78_06285 [Armatimonadetes bacterium]|nr:hypothetical protein [Armatimonadota bacterium]
MQEVNTQRQATADVLRCASARSLARSEPDLTLGDGFLKKTGAGNLFTIFGEPDIEIDT